jgi:hypothetical protein
MKTKAIRMYEGCFIEPRIPTHTHDCLVQVYLSMVYHRSRYVLHAHHTPAVGVDQTHDASGLVRLGVALFDGSTMSIVASESYEYSDWRCVDLGVCVWTLQRRQL